MYEPLGRSPRILLVDDDEADQLSTKRAFNQTQMQCDLYITSNGQEALDYLYHQGIYQDLASSPRPDLILLDLNMPKLDGREVLAKIMADEQLKSIPIIVLTTSTQEEDILTSYQLGCSSYITKPIGVNKFMDIIEGILHYWFNIIALPKKHVIQEYTSIDWS